MGSRSCCLLPDSEGGDEFLGPPRAFRAVLTPRITQAVASACDKGGPAPAAFACAPSGGGIGGVGAGSGGAGRFAGGHFAWVFFAATAVATIISCRAFCALLSFLFRLSSFSSISLMARSRSAVLALLSKGLESILERGERRDDLGGRPGDAAEGSGDLRLRSLRLLLGLRLHWRQ